MATNPFQVTILHADGKRIPVELTLSSLRDQEYKTVEIQGVAKRIEGPPRTKELPSYEEATTSL
jgi:hypothetical protein